MDTLTLYASLPSPVLMPPAQIQLYIPEANGSLLRQWVCRGKIRRHGTQYDLRDVARLLARP